MELENELHQEANPDQKIEIGAIYKHESGHRYQVDTIILNATGYESGTVPTMMVNYTQLDAGKYPAGTKWVREQSDFIKHFTKE